MLTRATDQDGITQEHITTMQEMGLPITQAESKDLDPNQEGDLPEGHIGEKQANQIHGARLMKRADLMIQSQTENTKVYNNNNVYFS